MYLVFIDGRMYGLHQDEAAYDHLDLHCFRVQLISFFGALKYDKATFLSPQLKQDISMIGKSESVNACRSKL